MVRVIILDAGPLGMATNPKSSAKNQACATWLYNLLANGVRVVIPEIADYELRRELIRAGKKKGLSKLDALAHSLDYLPLTTNAMRQAAIFWAQVRQAGQPTTSDAALDCDAIHAAQAHSFAGAAPVIATTNVGHLSRFVTAQLWHDIDPAVR